MSTVSIVMNCFNGEKYLREAVDSIFQQTYKDWEIIFWDNQSTDSSSKIIHSYNSPKVKYFKALENAPLSTARSLAVDKAQGDWIGFLDVDDYWYPEKLERQLNAIKNTDYALCYAGIREIQPNGTKIRDVLPSYPSGWMIKEQINHYDINMVTPIISRKFLNDNRLNFEKGLTCYADQNLFVRIAAKSRVCAIPEVMGVWRISPGSLSDQTVKNWATERRFNLQQLADENPGIEELYPNEFSEAYARSDYYEARNLILEGKVPQARILLKKIAGLKRIYFLLYLLSFNKYLWDKLHSHSLKRRLQKLYFFAKFKSS